MRVARALTCAFGAPLESSRASSGAHARPTTVIDTQRGERVAEQPARQPVGFPVVARVDQRRRTSAPAPPTTRPRPGARTARSTPSWRLGTCCRGTSCRARPRSTSTRTKPDERVTRRSRRPCRRPPARPIACFDAASRGVRRQRRRRRRSRSRSARCRRCATTASASDAATRPCSSSRSSTVETAFDKHAVVENRRERGAALGRVRRIARRRRTPPQPRSGRRPRVNARVNADVTPVPAKWLLSPVTTSTCAAWSGNVGELRRVAVGHAQESRRLRAR